MVNFASDDRIRLNDVGVWNITKDLRHMSIWVVNHISVPEDVEDDQNVKHAVLDLINLLCVMTRNKLLLVSYSKTQ
jgi:hypothetical protein